MNTELVFEGSHKQIGLQHGRTLREEISTALRTYVGMWGIPEEKIPPAVSGFKKRIIDAVKEPIKIPALFRYASKKEYPNNAPITIIKTPGMP